MCCDKCKNKGDDSYCGSCSNFDGDSTDSLFGIGKGKGKDSSSKEGSTAEQGEGGKKILGMDSEQLKGIGSTIGGIFSALKKKKKNNYEPSADQPSQVSDAPKSNTFMYVGIGVGVVVLIVIVYFVIRKK